MSYDLERRDEFARPVTSGEKALTMDQIKKLMEVIADINHRALLRLAISGGIRRSDIVGILSKNVKLENLSITFFQKKKKNYHTVYISQSVMNDLEAIKKINKNQWLFPSPYDPKKHLSSRHAYNILRRYTRKAKLPDIPFHALRATCYKICQAKGWLPTQAAKHLDDTLKTIEAHYATPSIEERQQVAQEKAIL